MSAPAAVIGTQHAKALRNAAQNHAIALEPLRSVADLLVRLAEDKHIGMLKTTAGHIADCVGRPFNELTIDALVGLVPRFTTYLEGRRHKRNAIRSYRNYLGMLVRKAKELGWRPQNAATPEAWAQVVASVQKLRGASSIVTFAVSLGRTPATLSDHDMDAWAQWMLVNKRDYQYVRTLGYRFRRELWKAGLAQKMPCLLSDWKVPSRRYFVPLEQFPTELRREVLTLLKWKQAPYAVGRKARAKLRAISARNLKNAFTRLYGFLINVLPKMQDTAQRIDVASIRTLPELVTPDSIGAALEWWLNVRHLKGRSVAVKLGAVCAAMKEHPAYKGIDFGWFDKLLQGIPYEPESQRRTRKEKKYLPYDKVAEIPSKIHALRAAVAKEGPTKLAELVHDELVIQWLVFLPWRQRNIRECRIGTKDSGANLFKAPMEQWDTVRKSRWVQEKLRNNPHEEFWQYHFTEEETKTGNEIWSIVPRRLVPLLEEYLGKHRQHLINGDDPGTLFVNRRGQPFDAGRLCALISNLTLRYAGRRVTPHIFRDIWAFWWLALHPEDYLTVSKKLWHRNIQTTLRIYGCKFDEAQADCRVEDWLDANGSSTTESE